MECTAKLHPNCFSANVSIQAGCILATNLKKPTILPEIVGFLKFVGKIQQLPRKRPQKNHQDIILHYISLSIYPL